MEVVKENKRNRKDECTRKDGRTDNKMEVERGKKRVGRRGALARGCEGEERQTYRKLEV